MLKKLLNISRYKHVQPGLQIDSYLTKKYPVYLINLAYNTVKYVKTSLAYLQCEPKIGWNRQKNILSIHKLIKTAEDKIGW